jgi:predicted PolB exonuclease-like 3'-5' exonuclease
MGLPGKPKGFDGGEVERRFNEGKIREIADYCQVDVINTYRVWAALRAVSRHAESECFRGERAQSGRFHGWASSRGWRP